MIIWDTTEFFVYSMVFLMIIFKLWSVWHVSLQSGANKQGRIIFIGIISSLTAFGIIAKLYISAVMNV